MSDFDGVLDSLGGFGSYQRQVFLLVSAFETPAAWAMLLPVFIGATPKWWLLPSSGSDYAQNNTNLSESAVWLNEGLCPNKSDMIESQSTTCDHVAFDDSFTSIVTQFCLICDMKYVSDLITTLQMVGLVIGATISGQIADIYGRKKVLFVTYLLLLVSNFASGFANSWQLYAAIRLVVGAAIGGMLVVNFILPIEYVGIKWRTFCGCVGLWAIGVMSLPGMAYFLRNWSHLCIATSCAGMPLLALWWFIPESCRWLVTRGRYDEAEKIILDMARRNGKPLPDLSLLRSFAKTEEELKNQRRKFSYWHLFINPRSALLTCICMYAWFASSSVYYGVSYNIKNLAGDRYLNVFLSGLVEIPALIFVLLVNNRIGRRWTVFTLFLISAVSLGSIMIIDLTHYTSDVAVLVMALIGKSAIAGGWAAVQVFSAEKFPTLLRNLGIASCAFASRIGGVIAPQIVSLSDKFSSLPFVIFGVIALLCAVTSVTMSETAKLPLPDKIETKERRKKQPDPVELSEHPILGDRESAERQTNHESNTADSEKQSLSDP